MSKFNLVKQTYEFATFSAYDYSTVKRILIDRMRTEFPEVFNDYTEFDELIMIINSFAYISELFAYRLDINAQENFIQTALIKENVIKLAEWVGYTPQRCLPARTLFKVDSITPKFDIIDLRGENLKNREIRWNDSNNVFWKSQFFTIMQASLEQEVLNADENTRVQIGNTIIERYTLPSVDSLFGITSINSSEGVPFEIIPSSITSNGFSESVPRSSNSTSVFLLDDNTSDSSPTTGFFFDVTQGTLSQQTISFTNKIPNNTVQINISNINQFDVWLYEVGTDTFWSTVDQLYFSNKTTTKIFRTRPVNDDVVELVFGDGVISDIPIGDFVVYYRTSLNENRLLTKQTLSSLVFGLPLYFNNARNIINFKISCQTDLSATASETMQHIKRVASNQFQIQDRLVTEYDYKYFFQRDPRILCNNIDAVKRIGESSYFRWNNQSLSNFDLIEDDAFCFINQNIVLKTFTNTIEQTVADYIESDIITDLKMVYTTSAIGCVNPTRTYFTHTLSGEYAELLFKLGVSTSTSVAVPTFPIAIKRSKLTDQWLFVITTRDSDGLPVWSYDDVIVIDKINDGTSVVWKIFSKMSSTSVGKNYFDMIVDDYIHKQTFSLNSKNIDSYGQQFGDNVVLQANTPIYDDNGVVITNCVNVIDTELTVSGLPNYLTLFDQPTICVKMFTVDTYVDSGIRYIDIPITNLPVVPYTQDVVKILDSTNTNVNFEYLTTNYTATRKIKVFTSAASVNLYVKQYVFLTKTNTQLILSPTNFDLFNQCIAYEDKHPTIRRVLGMANLILKYTFKVPFFSVLNVEQTNLIQIHVITTTMISAFKKYLLTGQAVSYPSTFDLDSQYGYLINKRMISDNVAILSGKIVPFIGPSAIPQRQARIVVKKNPNGFLLATDIKKTIIDVIQTTFDADFTMGETIYTSQLQGILSYKLINEILDIKFISTNPATYGKDLEFFASDKNELLFPHITYDDIIVTV